MLLGFSVVSNAQAYAADDARTIAELKAENEALKRLLQSKNAEEPKTLPLAPVAAPPDQQEQSGPLAAAGADGSATQGDAEVDTLNEVVVTGSRQTGIKARASASPVTVISSSTLKGTGQVNLIDALNKLEPSFYVPARSGDVGNLTRQVQLRQLGPNQTLVLINGKRRHSTAIVNASGTFAGATAVDLAQIPVSAIDHVEILKDGAAAQYGTDAIAGVVNIILKSANHGGSVTVGYGRYDQSDVNPQSKDNGQTENVAVNGGFKLGDADQGFLNLSAEWTDKDYTNNSGQHPTIKAANIPSPGWVNRIAGEPAYQLYDLGFNAGFKLTDDIELYGFGTAGHRKADAQQNFRRYNLLPAVYPTGFVPTIGIEETDLALTAGAKGAFLGDGRWDFSSTYGRDDADIIVEHSANQGLYRDKGFTPTKFENGTFKNSQWTTNLDLTKPVDVDFLPAPLNVAGGVEFRRETYQLIAGDAASRYKEGSQAFPGYQFSDARNESRHVEAIYVELGTKFTPEWQTSLAGRFEHYSDAGDTAIGKGSTRYDFNPRLAIRGTASSGFRAPTLAEQNFSATNVSPSFSNIQLAVNSPAAQLLGAPALKPEESSNFSVGLVFEPIQKVYASLDIYQINISDRIVNTGNLNGPAVRNAIAANGIFFQGSSANLNFFTNGVDTRTRGVDAAADWATEFDEYGRIKWNFTASYIDTKVTDIKNASAQLGGGALITPVIVSGLEDSNPKYKLSLAANYFISDWSFNARVTHYGESSQLTSDAGTGLAPFTRNTIKDTALLDLSVGYDLTSSLNFVVGANNVFDTHPNKTKPITRGSTNAAVYPTFSPYPVDGAFYYARATFHY
ncbi:TonB-dependent siderophore receptor [Methylococcus sp. EFPC2]|uniref:TonB-dependent receptor plug domain-containing protein n=1 Tax=Methylococcus sp. EFPC2 TaxID=2812648 RepID=UPI0019686D5D|nr:TonB-dependent receptor [Methylococcus sp. EFPC2]QSA97383.1 TonB-dependent receptor [Methylococcus sp. EFPC2]